MRYLPALAFGLGMALASSGPAFAQDTPTESELSAPSETSESDRELSEDDKLAEEPGEEGQVEAETPSITLSEILDKVHLAVRVGFGMPLGVFSGEEDRVDSGGIPFTVKAQSLNDSVIGMVPIWLDLGYFLTPKIMVGIYGHYAFVFPKGCADAASCSGNDIRFGVQGQYHLSRGEKLNPWFGLGFGYEFWNGFVEVSGQERTLSYQGFEFANLQGGADFKLTEAIAAGPFLSVSFGQYGSCSSLNGQACAGVSADDPAATDADVDPKGLHEWIVIGGRGTFGL